MKEQLQQIQAVAIVTFLCILISVNSTGDYGKWFVVDGARETVDPETGNSTGYNTFQYSYYLDSYLFSDTSGTSESVIYDGQDCTYCLNKVESANNARMTAYAAGVLALVVAYMAYNAVSSLHQKTLRSALKNLKYVAILVLIVGFMSTFLFYSTWSEALVQDEVALSSTNADGSDTNKELGCLKNLLNFYGEGTCEEYVQLKAGEADRVTGRLSPVSWSPGIGFIIVLIGSALTGGGTLYILGNIDEEWQAILKKQELIERQQDINDGELEKSKELMQEFEDTEERLKEAEKRIEDVRSSANDIDYDGIEDLENELDRITALNQSVNTLNSSLESKLKTARMATSEVEKRARMAESELQDDLSAKNNLEKEIEDLRTKHENDMRLSDRMTREIGSLRTMSDDAETKAVNAERKLKLEKPDTVNALESYDSVKASYDKTVDEKNNLEKEIMELEQHTLEANEREKSAIAERNEAINRRKELDREVKLMEKNKKRINDKFTTLTTNLEKAKKELNEAREKASLTMNELDIERQTIIELEQNSNQFREKENEILGMTDSLKELQEQVDNQKESNKKIDDELKIEVKSKEKTQKDLSALENASKQVSKVMQTLKKQFEEAKVELNINIDDRNKAERLLEAEKSEHEKLKEDLEFLQGTTIGNEEDTERKIKAMEVEIPKEKALADEMNLETQELSDSNKELEEKINEARIESLNKPQPTNEVSSVSGASVGTSLIVKNLTKETEHTFELVNPEDANIPQGKIPLSNPIGKSLEGSKEGDEVKVGPTTFKVLKVN
ncbi:MAG: hypothetical protein BEU02_01185 [Marine Group III euryarchaeote CG-Epi5]|uniref:Transcription elongation factor GreA/GreB C-terminal domain-containing protein n=1 Tax=Marine Group III euryarchaeote CG-Epi5 TaxID=1888999 RepID=A0A1J5TNG6_9ARCH|nr:MAG: hypothetical protein BEU02_01185 [Marine Group III euryarchaeote CG-Epi5]